MYQPPDDNIHKMVYLFQFLSLHNFVVLNILILFQGITVKASEILPSDSSVILSYLIYWRKMLKD